MKIGGEVRIPSSKSQAHRALICGALAGNSKIRSVDLSNDINATVSALRCLGAEIYYDEGEKCFIVKDGCKRGIRGGVINCGESASTLRFLIPVAAALEAEVTFVGEGRLPFRPTDIYKSILEKNGAELKYPEGDKYLPLHLAGKLTAGRYSLRGDVSSQFVTGLLLALTLTEGESEIVLSTELESKPYADLTVEALGFFGGKVEETPQGYKIFGHSLSPADITVEGDFSQAAFFAAAAALGGRVRLKGVSPNTRQGDFAILEITRRFGAEVTWSDDSAYIASKGRLKGIDIDVRNIPDLVPALGVMAAVAEGTTKIYGGERLRLKESDRIKTTAAMLNAIGADVRETVDGLIIEGKEKLCGGFVHSANDHRIAMAAAVASVGCTGEVTVDDMSCINKSYPEFVRDFRKVQIY